MKQVLGCREISEQLMDCARHHEEPNAALTAHTAGCAKCSERWSAERNLAMGLRMMRTQASAVRTPHAVREALMTEFAESRRKPVAFPAPSRRWVWSLAAAALILLSTFAARNLLLKPVSPPVAQQSEAQSETQQEGFIEVPYAPPLAPGELISVVHTELQPAELASLGVNVDPSWTTELPADLLVGQDGFPRAVRVSDEEPAPGGF
jgi:hypothetical protein